MTAQAAMVRDSTFSSGVSIAPPRRLDLEQDTIFAPVADTADAEHQDFNRAAAHDFFVEVVGRTYPLWLNVVASVVLSLVPVGLILVYLSPGISGLIVLGIGFFGIWVFGDIAARLGRNIRIVRNVGAGWIP